MTPEVIVHHPLPNELRVMLEQLGYSPIEVAASHTRYALVRDGHRVAGDHAAAARSNSPLVEERGLRRQPEGRAATTPSSTEPLHNDGKQIEWINIPELARLIGLSKEAVYRLARTDSIPGMVRMGRRLVVNYSFFVTASVSDSSAGGNPSSPPITPAA